MFTGPMIEHGWLTIWGVIIGTSLGIKFPDIDLHVGFLVHRSILTHGFWLPLLMFGLAFWFGKLVLRAMTIGLCVAIAVHLCFDLFPKAWWGAALIHVPGIGRLPGVLSFLWIAFSAISALYIVFLLMTNLLEMVLALGVTIFSFAIYAHEGLALPLLAFVILLGVVLLLPDSWFPLQILQPKQGERV